MTDSVSLPAARLHHLGYLVPDLSAALRHFTQCLGYETASDPVIDEGQTAEVCFLSHPDMGHWLELVTPRGPQSKLQRALEQGGGPHHTCYQVQDVAAALSVWRGFGYFPVSKVAPGAAFGGRLIAWLYAREYGLVELVEAGPGPLDRG